MFPLHESTILLLAMTAVVAGTALWVALRGQPALWRSALLLVAGVAWPWPMAAFLGLDSYTMGAAFLAGAWTTGAVLVGLVWGNLVRRIPGALPVALVALVPSLVGAALLLERQRVPEAACAAEVEFHVGDLRLDIPRGLGLHSVAADGAPAQAWQGYYGNEPGGKPHVRALCRATDGGTKPIEIHHAWMSFSSFRRDIEAECEGGSVPPSRLGVCDALTRMEPTVVQLYALPEGIKLPSLGQFNPALITEARARGQREGYRCNDSTNGPQRRFCTVWQPMTPEVFAVSSAWLGPVQDGEDPLADSEVLLGELKRKFAAE